MRAPITTMVAAAAALCAAVAAAPAGHADTVAYLVNVAVQPVYGFNGPDSALAYGYGICDKVRANQTYTQLIAGVRGDITLPDEYKAAYLINQAVNELCPDQIWQLRNSAVHYRPAPA
jgi:opacity protein-like surface antigen